MTCRERVPETLARLGRMLATSQGVRRGGSAALDLCYVACGRVDGFYEETSNPGTPPPASSSSPKPG